MITRRTNETIGSDKPFHEVFPYGLSWFIKEGNKNIQHFAYFPYDDYRAKYIQRYKREGGTKFKRFKTEPRKC